MKKIKIALLVLISCSALAQKDSLYRNAKHELALEIDPAPFILGGYSFSLKYSFPKLKHVTFMGSVYSSRFPDKMMEKVNYSNGFRDLKIETSYAVFTDYFINADRTGFHFGPSVFIYSKSVSQLLKNERINFESVYPNFRVGYVYVPFQKAPGFYVNPWFNVGKEFKVGGSQVGSNFAQNNISYILALHIGYKYTIPAECKNNTYKK